MSKSFGYLNEGNPLTIRDNEAQIMVNCAVERGWIEYKAYPVPTGLYDCVPNREVTLPDDYGTLLRIVNDDNSYAKNGHVRMIRKYDNAAVRFGIDMPSSFHPSVAYVVPSLAGNATQADGYYQVVTSSILDVQSGIASIKMPIMQGKYGDNTPFSLYYDSSFVERSVLKSVKVNNVYLSKDKYTILQSEDNCPVLVLADPVPEHPNPTDQIPVEIEWNYFFGICFLVKESQTVFYAFTIKDNQRSLGTGGNAVLNENYNRESPPRLVSKYVPEPTAVGAYVMKLTFTMPNDTWAVTPRLNMYRMPFGGSEYLFDAYYDQSVSNQIDLVTDDKLGEMLQTEGDSDNYLDVTADCIMIHNDRLFIAEDKLLVFSKPSQYDEFPAENFYAFQDQVIDLCKYDSNLAVFTKTKSYIIYGAGTDGFVISEIDWKTEFHIRNCARSVYTSLISLCCEEPITIEGESYPSTRRNSVVQFNHRYARDISLRVRDTLNKGVIRNTIDTLGKDCANRNTVLENRYYVAELRYYESATATDGQVKTFNLVYDVIADGFCLYDTSVKDFNNQSVFKYRTKEFKASTSPTPQAQYHKGVYVKGKGTFKVNVYADGELVTSLTHNETDNEKPLRIILHNIGNKRASTISLEFIGTEGAQIHDWEVYD